jgi:hypothetical protein
MYFIEYVDSFSNEINFTKSSVVCCYTWISKTVFFMSGLKDQWCSIESSDEIHCFVEL